MKPNIQNKEAIKMKTPSQQIELIQHAANIIEEQATELHIAFALPNGSYYSKDRDIEAEINDMKDTVTELKFLASI